jgi:hypothetical protein
MNPRRRSAPTDLDPADDVHDIEQVGQNRGEGARVEIVERCANLTETLRQIASRRSGDPGCLGQAQHLVEVALCQPLGVSVSHA